ncbi:MAG: sulfotransferase [Nitrospirae bacterium]|nr:sulfotransferase [Nitrospirota bacterium]
MSLFMIGTQRSGSNLLRLMLNQQPAIAAPHPPHILERFIPLLPLYGDLQDDKNFDLLIDDVCRMIELNPVPWEGVTLDRKTVRDCCFSRSLMAVYGAVHDLLCEAKGAFVWVCKSLANVHFLPEITGHFADARFIYLFRDGRDVALSFRKAVVGEKSFYHIAKQWHAEQRLALDLRDRSDPSCFFSLSYEQLTSDTENTLRNLMTHFRIPFSEEMLRFNISEDAFATAKSGSLWANVVKPVMKENTRKFIAEAPLPDIRTFESVAGESLDRLGYERYAAKKGEEIKFTEADLLGFEAENNRLKKEISSKLTEVELQLRRPQQQLIEEIKARR